MKNEHLAPRPTLIGVGEIAPDFALPTQDKGEWRLSDHVKKGDVVLSFVPFAFTSTCSTEMRCISDDLATWTAKGAAVVGVDCDSPAANKAWAEKEGYKHPILADLHRAVCRAYGLYWPDLNVANRGTIVVARSTDGRGKVSFAQARPPSQAMNWGELLARL